MNGDNGTKIGLCMHLRVLWEQHVRQTLKQNDRDFFNMTTKICNNRPAAIKLTRSTDTCQAPHWTHVRKNAFQFLASNLNLFFFKSFLYLIDVCFGCNWFVSLDKLIFCELCLLCPCFPCFCYEWWNHIILSNNRYTFTYIIWFIKSSFLWKYTV